jgi:hypothetical protein
VINLIRKHLAHREILHVQLTLVLLEMLSKNGGMRFLQCMAASRPLFAQLESTCRVSLWLSSRACSSRSSCAEPGHEEEGSRGSRG